MSMVWKSYSTMEFLHLQFDLVQLIGHFSFSELRGELLIKPMGYEI